MIFEKDSLKNFLRSFFTLHQCKITGSGSDDLWTVDIPAEKRGFFDGASELHLCFDRELVTLQGDYAYVTLGAPLFNQIKEAYGDERLYTTGFITVSEEQSKKWAVIPPSLSFIRCTPRFRESVMMMRPMVRFNFKLTISSDEKQEEIFPILIDGLTVKMANPLLIRLKDSVIEDTVPEGVTLLPVKPLQELKKKAHEVAAIKMKPLLEHLQSVNNKKMFDEIAAALLFYQREYESLAKEKRPSPGDFEKNRDKEVREIRERFTLSFELSLLNVMRCYAPLQKNMIDVEAGEHSFSLSIDCDLLQDEAYDPLCPRCGAHFREIHCCSSHGLFCTNELWVCQSCRNDQCTQCMKTICGDSSCRKTICSDCSLTCPQCGIITCREHRRSCSQCGKEGCTICIIPDKREGTLLCSDCGGNCSCCGGFFPKDELTQCDMDGKMICRACTAGLCSDSGCTRKTLCKSHGKLCRICSMTFCPDHLRSCPLCSEKVCSADSEKCTLCDTIYCRDHFAQCTVCEKRLCPHCASWKFTQCSRDGKVLCKDHAVTCAFEGKAVCREHTGRCPVCGNQMCKEHFKYCNKCGEALCPTCQSRCVTCNTVFCQRHVRNCPACENDFCGKHRNSCAGCGVELCVQCLDSEKKLCKACSSLFPLPHGCQALNNFLKAHRSAFPEIDRIPRWKYSTCGDYEVFRGSAATWSITFAVRKGMIDQLLSWRRGGFIEKIKWFFGA